MLRIFPFLFIFLLFGCGTSPDQKKELTGPHAVIRIFITNSFHTGGFKSNDSLYVYPIPKNKSVNDHYSALLQSRDLLKKVLVKCGRKGNDAEAESIRENMKFFTIGKTDLLQIEIYNEEAKFACTFLDTLVETFNKAATEQLYESSQRKIKVITDQIDSVAMKLHELEEYVREDNEILNLEDERQEYFNAYLKLESKKAMLKKLKDCLSRNIETCSSEYVPDGLIEDEYLTRALDDLYKLNTEKNQIQCPEAGNEACKKLDKKINTLKSDIDTYLKNFLSALDEEGKIFEANIKKLPKTRHEISREFEVNQKMYQYLIEKKTELSIGMAGIFSPIRVIDKAGWEQK